MVEKELRNSITKFEIREQPEESNVLPTIEGYALKFNTRSQPLPVNGARFIETIDAEALRSTDMSNVSALINHDTNQVLGRSGVNLELSVDDVGLRFKVIPTNTSYARDLVENVRSGVINQCSFAFTIPQGKQAQSWTRSAEQGIDYERNIRAIDKLFDVSIVLNPAYTDTSATVGARSIDFIKKLNVKPAKDKRQQILQKVNNLEIKRLLDKF